jgi:O-acetyl-ADP-ribose deacetylase (regulator of RNase III)
MNSITYVEGDATRPHGDGLKIIAHICNNRGSWGAGFVLALSDRSLIPEETFHAAGRMRLGEIQITAFVPNEHILVCNMCAQDGFGTNTQPPVRYAPLATCLIKLHKAATTSKASVHMPRIGCGLGGGQWSVVEALVTHYIVNRGIPVTVYDL